MLSCPPRIREESYFYDHSILSNLLTQINNHKVTGKHIIVGCTVMPKYIDEIGSFLLRDCPHTTLNYNPEFIAQGEIIHGFLNPDMILIGTTSSALADTLKEIYHKIVGKHPHILRADAAGSRNS